jgi:hypothetical protein
VTGNAKPARCNSAPTSRKSAKGATRGDTPPSHSASAYAKACRSSVSVSPALRPSRSSSTGGFRMTAILAGMSISFSLPI